MRSQMSAQLGSCESEVEWLGLDPRHSVSSDGLSYLATILITRMKSLHWNNNSKQFGKQSWPSDLSYCFRYTCSNPSWCISNIALCSAHPSMQQMMAQVLASLLTHRRDLNWVLHSWLWPGPALDAVGVFEMWTSRWKMSSDLFCLTLSLFHCH